MKNRISKFGLPLAAVILAVAGAFASTNSHTNDGKFADRPGYVKNGSVCTVTAITCSTNFNTFMCTDGTNILHDWNGSSCPLELYKK